MPEDPLPHTNHRLKNVRNLILHYFFACVRISQSILILYGQSPIRFGRTGTAYDNQLFYDNKLYRKTKQHLSFSIITEFMLLSITQHLYLRKHLFIEEFLYDERGFRLACLFYLYLPSTEITFYRNLSSTKGEFYGRKQRIQE